MRHLWIILLCCISQVFGVYFIMGEKETRCFSDDFTEGSVVSFRYNATIGDGSPIGLIVQVNNPSHKMLLEREYGSGSTVSYKVEDTGEHMLCVNTNSSKWAMYATGTIKVHFKFEVDFSGVEKDDQDDDKEDDEEEDEEPNDENTDGDNKLKILRHRVKDVLHSVRSIVKVMESHRKAEEAFRYIAETTNSRVFVWAFVHFALLLLTGLWQMRNLKAFFLAKKIA